MPLWLFPISMLLAFEVVADVLAQEYSLHGGWIWWSVAILGYVIANSFWLYAIRHGSGLARGAIIFSVGSAVLACLIAILYYKEQVSPTQIVGLVLGIVALALLV